MTQADWAHKTMTGQKINTAKWFEEALEIQERTGCDIKLAKEIVTVSEKVNDIMRGGIVFGDMVGWGRLGEIPQTVMNAYNDWKKSEQAAAAYQRQVATDAALNRALRGIAKILLTA